MNSCFCVLLCALGCLLALPLEQPNKNASNDVIQVQLTGMLSSPPLEVSAAKEKTYSGSVFAGGRELLLDCAGNDAAKELLRKTYAELGKHTGFVPRKNVEVKGRLQFRPYILCDAAGKQIEHNDTLAVIVVESLKLVE